MQELLNGLGLAAVAGLSGVVFTFWNQLKGLLQQVRGFFLQEDLIHMQYVLLWWLTRRCRPAKFSANFYRAETFRSRVDQDWWMLVFYQSMGEGVSLFWYGWRPIWVKLDGSKMSVTYFRGSLPTPGFWQQMIDEYVAHIKSHRRRYFYVNHVTGERKSVFVRESNRDLRANDDPNLSPADSGFLSCCSHEALKCCDPVRLAAYKSQPTNVLGSLALTPEIEEVASEVRHWLDSREWFKTRGIPWKRGYTFSGVPGTGKTAVASALGEDLTLPIYIFHLNTLDDQEFQREWARMREAAPCIALLEDFHTAFEGRKSTKGYLSFDTILNCVDGVEQSDGILLIVTTNDESLIDEAFGVPDARGHSSRPGRIDRVVRFGPLDRDGRWKLANRICNDLPEADRGRLVDEGDGDTGAQFQERCYQAARRHFERGLKDTKLRLVSAS